MDQPKKAKGSRSVKKEAATPEVAPFIPVQEKPEASDKTSPDTKAKKVYVSESGFTIEDN